MPKKQPTPPFGIDTAPDNVPMPTRGIVRPTINAQAGNSAVVRSKGTPKVNAAKPTDNPFAGSNWDGHEQLLGF